VKAISRPLGEKLGEVAVSWLKTQIPADIAKPEGKALARQAWFAVADQSGRGQLRGAEFDASAIELQQQFVPTVYLYDNFPGGVGLSEPLWLRQAELLQRAQELVQRCDCKAGCPACVGPVLAGQEDDATTPKALALKVLALFDEQALPAASARAQHEAEVVPF